MSEAEHPAAAGTAIAEIVLEGFHQYRRRFRRLTVGARDRFERAAWHEAQQAAMERTDAYPKAVTQVCERLRQLYPLPAEVALWRVARTPFIDSCADLPDWELAETFFNSVYCRLWEHGDIRDANLFVHSAWDEPPAAPHQDFCQTYLPQDFADWRAMLRGMLQDFGCALPWQDLERDLGYMLQALQDQVPEAMSDDSQVRIELLTPAFFRNKGAYIVGRLQLGDRTCPFTPVVLNDEAGQVFVDTLILDEDELSIIFSFTRTYFMVDTDMPFRLVRFLSELLPAKKRFELYNSIGLNKHGKTELYRDLLDHLARSRDPFVKAPGIPGMVMAVFTLPSYQTAFKIIKDRFPPQKEVTREQVMAAYRLVKMHDRVGRMADTQEFNNLRLPLARFDQEMLAELLDVAARNVRVEGGEVVIGHCYTERQMTPLNMYLEQVDDDDLLEVLDQYGNAIRQLAAANIFPGDMLLKNFGVTRHGRVVFYDYDEICYLTDVNFRHFPRAQTPDQQMAAEPWYSVGPYDVFPEEFSRFMFGNPRIKQLFTEIHGEIFDPEYWRGLQAAIRDGQLMDVFPYGQNRRFSVRFAAA